MLYSVVIPTRDRLDLLTGAVETVLLQPEGVDWELIVFDNASSQPVGEYVRGLKEPRIRYERSDKFLPVTDSWNQALSYAKGDYVTFLGDDDGLTPNYFRNVSRVIEEFGHPELLYSAIYQFMHPGVAPWAPEGYVSDLRWGFFFGDRTAPFLLSPAEAHHAVVGSLHLRRNFTYNSQAFCFSRALLSRLGPKGDFYYSPFPDYYLANVALAHSRSTVIVPSPLAIAGVSKASFGFTLFNGQQERGESLLNTVLAEDPVYGDIEAKLLPGPMYQIKYAITMEHVARHVREIFYERVDWDRHRRLQIVTALQDGNHGTPADVVWPELRRRLSPSEGEWADAVKALFDLNRKSPGPVIGSKVIPDLLRRVSPYDLDPPQRFCDRGTYSRLMDVYTALESGALH
jgi:glycosyltransferase involved in cell wall biosynthesis